MGDFLTAGSGEFKKSGICRSFFISLSSAEQTHLSLAIHSI
jgi:hypothetical protein